MFESLLSMRVQAGHVWTDRALALATAIHLSVLATVVLAFHLVLVEVKSPNPPEALPIFVARAELKLPGPPEAGSFPRDVKPPKPTQDSLVQPKYVPEPVETETKTPESDPPAEVLTSEYDGVEHSGVDPTGVGPGNGTGGPGGSKGNGEGLPGSHSDNDAPIDAERDSSVTKPEAIEKADPIYPRLAQLSRIEGVVRLEAVIGVDGQVESVAVKDGNPVLAEAARTAVLRWRYRPALRGGQPIRVFMTVRVAFSLR